MTGAARETGMVHIGEILVEFEHVERILIVGTVHAAETALHGEIGPSRSRRTVFHQESGKIGTQRFENPVQIANVINPEPSGPIPPAGRTDKAVHIQFEIFDPGFGNFAGRFVQNDRRRRGTPGRGRRGGLPRRNGKVRGVRRLSDFRNRTGRRVAARFADMGFYRCVGHIRHRRQNRVLRIRHGRIMVFARPQDPA